MGLFKARSNKKFSYAPRHYESDKEGSPFHIEQKFDKFRKTIGNEKNLRGKFMAAIDDFRNYSDKQTSRRILIIISILLLLFLVVIDFDLTIFYRN
jgi:hypothetical protein